MFRNSNQAKSVLIENHKSLKLQALLRILDVDTRWNSTLTMLVRYMQQEAAVDGSLLHPKVGGQSIK